MMTLKESQLVISPAEIRERKCRPVGRLLLVGDQPHDSPVFGEHLRPDQDPEHGEDLQEEVLEDAGAHRSKVIRERRRKDERLSPSGCPC